MKCTKCKLVEMLVEKIENEKAIHVCKKCGERIEQDFNVESK